MLGGRSVTEFNYRFADATSLHFCWCAPEPVVSKSAKEILQMSTMAATA
ncbi:hypothetical protein ACNKHN_21620 [Shigella flexneri]